MTVTMPQFIWNSHSKCSYTTHSSASTNTAIHSALSESASSTPRSAREELNGNRSNNGHVYFLWVLKRCHEIFEDRVQIVKVSRPAGTIVAESSRPGHGVEVKVDTVDIQVMLGALPDDMNADEAEKEGAL